MPTGIAKSQTDEGSIRTAETSVWPAQLSLLAPKPGLSENEPLSDERVDMFAATSVRPAPFDNERPFSSIRTFVTNNF
jgi:hypothetical protein